MDRCFSACLGVLLICGSCWVSTPSAQGASANPSEPPSEATFSTGAIPTRGEMPAGLEVLDEAMKRFMESRTIPAGVLVVSRQGKIVLERGYGWRDRSKHHPVEIDTPFRIASLTKPITAAAVRKLIAEGRLKLTDHAFDLEQPGGGILKLVPAGAPDARLRLVTVAHLLAHKGGWDREKSGDPMFDGIAIAERLGIRTPPPQEAIVRYVMGRPLDHDPGSTYAYSNFGYLVLGLIVEKVTGGDYVRYIQKNIFAPLKVPRNEVQLGRTLPRLRDPREPWYSDPNRGPSLFRPKETVLLQDGGFHLEVMEAHGGLVTTARAYDRFLQSYWVEGNPRKGNGQNWTFFGSLPGTFTMGRQRPDGVNLTVFFNQRTDRSGLPYEAIRETLDRAVDSVVTWPVARPSTNPRGS